MKQHNFGSRIEEERAGVVSSGTVTVTVTAMSWDNLHCTSGAVRRMQCASVAKRLRSVGNNRKAVLIHAERLAGQTLLSGCGCHLGRAACQSSLHPSSHLQLKPSSGKSLCRQHSGPEFLDEVCGSYSCSFSG